MTNMHGLFSAFGHAKAVPAFAPQSRRPANFIHDRRGAILILFALLLPFLLGLVGLSAGTGDAYRQYLRATASLETAMRTVCAIDNRDPHADLNLIVGFFNLNYYVPAPVDQSGGAVPQPDVVTAENFTATVTGYRVEVPLVSGAGKLLGAVSDSLGSVSVEVTFPVNCR